MISKGALSHIKVLDLTRVLAGPWAGQTLADMGADVIKVEQPGKGDDTRTWGPPFLKDENDEQTSESAYFLCANRGKRSICLDLSSDQGQLELRRLVSECDVLIENFKVGQLRKFKLDYETLSSLNPRLVYCSITGFGQHGPYANRPGYDFMIQGMSGLMSVTGSPDGEPQKVGVAVTDLLTGLYSVVGILAALSERENSGLGQHVDLSLFDVSVAAMANQASNHLIGEVTPKAMGNAHPNIVPYQCFATSDGHCIVAVGNDAQFARFCEAIDLPELALNTHYRTNRVRVKNRKQLVELISNVMQSKTSEQWLSLLSDADVPAGPINTMADVFRDPQVIMREMKITMAHPHNRKINLVGSPLKFSRTPVVYHRAPPLLGQHTDEVISKNGGWN
ncbi:CaiB/BaiF CoA-transferase family protein [Arenicella sp. 4NH20-0111]|uniref:CaiB/BaiF CoA transferase family protein n=1 Tax=Arenicella sp. 4NH20-0111 TaxID=3127648 RepID=UPI003103D6C5